MSQPESYQGKVKTVEFLDENRVRIIFTDQITAGDGAKREILSGKGEVNLKTTLLIMNKLNEAGIPNHILETEGKNTIIARKLTIFPVEVVVRNIAAGSFSRRYGIEQGSILSPPVVEFFVKDDELHDPLIDMQVAVSRGLLSREEAEILVARALQVNAVLVPFFSLAGLDLVDFKLEFGYDTSGMIFLADEISADSIRVWDSQTKEVLDKDRFRKDMGGVIAGYQSLYDRLATVDYVPQKLSLFVTIHIKPKPAVMNPAGEVIKRTLVNAGLEHVGSVRMGKTIEVEILDSTDNTWFDILEKTTQEILTNPLIELYEYHYFWK